MYSPIQHTDAGDGGSLVPLVDVLLPNEQVLWSDSPEPRHVILHIANLPGVAIAGMFTTLAVLGVLVMPTEVTLVVWAFFSACVLGMLHELWMVHPGTRRGAVSYFLTTHRALVRRGTKGNQQVCSIPYKYMTAYDVRKKTDVSMRGDVFFTKAWPHVWLGGRAACNFIGVPDVDAAAQIIEEQCAAARRDSEAGAPAALPRLMLDVLPPPQFHVEVPECTTLRGDVYVPPDGESVLATCSAVTPLTDGHYLALVVCVALVATLVHVVLTVTVLTLGFLLVFVSHQKERNTTSVTITTHGVVVAAHHGLPMFKTTLHYPWTCVFPMLQGSWTSLYAGAARWLPERAVRWLGLATLQKLAFLRTMQIAEVPLAQNTLPHILLVAALQAPLDGAQATEPDDHARTRMRNVSMPGSAMTQLVYVVAFVGGIFFVPSLW